MIRTRMSLLGFVATPGCGFFVAVALCLPCLVGPHELIYDDSSIASLHCECLRFLETSVPSKGPWSLLPSKVSYSLLPPPVVTLHATPQHAFSTCLVVSDLLIPATFRHVVRPRPFSRDK
jgi:hypothetical protein